MGNGALLRQARPCPFATEADGDKHELQFLSEMVSLVTYVSCSCGARSPSTDNPAAAIKRWNTRYADTAIANVQGIAGRAVIGAQQKVDESEKKFSAMQVENNRLLERAQTAEAALELTTKLAEKAATDHG